jgi:hypothetical protein
MKVIFLINDYIIILSIKKVHENENQNCDNTLTVRKKAWQLDPDPPGPAQTRPEFSGQKPFLLGTGAGKTRILNTGAGAGCAYPRPALLKSPYYPYI